MTIKNTTITALATTLMASVATADMTGRALEMGYGWSGEDFGGTSISGYVVDLYMEFDSIDDVLLNVYNFNAINQADNPTYFQGTTAAGWNPNEQGGIFTIEGAEGELLERILNTSCPTILFPYGRETVDSVVVKGSLPPLMLAPINFESLYENQKNQKSN